MIETIIKRAIGVAIFASILVVVVPWLFDSSGDVLTEQPPELKSMLDNTTKEISQVISNASQGREQLLKKQQQSILLHGKPARLKKIEARPIPMPITQDQAQQNQITENLPKSQEAEKPIASEQTGQKTIAEKIAEKPLQQPPDTNAPPAAAPQPKPESNPNKASDTLDAFIQLHREKWVVQLGLFSLRSNAEKLQKQLKNTMGDMVFVREVTINNKNYNGVFLGPHAEKKDAERSQAQALNAFNIQGYVRPFSAIAWQQ